jgi:hypothetical protein
VRGWNTYLVVENMILRDLLYMMLIIGVLSIGIVGFLSPTLIASGSPYPISSVISNQTLNNLNNTMSNMENPIRSGSVTGFTIIDVPLMIVNGAFTAVKMMFDVPASLIGLFNDLGESLFTDTLHVPLPGWLFTAALLGLGIFVLFEILSALLKYRV